MAGNNIEGLPERFVEKGFKNFYPRDETESGIKEKLIAFARDPNETRSLLLTGHYGTGKTHLAVAVTKNLAPVRRRMITSRMESEVNETEVWLPANGIFLVADELFQELNDCSIERKSKESRIKNYLRSYDVMVVDDLRPDNFTAAKAENLYLLVNRAYLDARRLIITTNLSMEGLEKLEPRVASRLAEMSLVIRFTGKDFRKG